MKIKKTTVLIIVLASLSIVGLFFFVIQKDNVPAINNDTADDYHTIEYKGETYYYNTDIVTILLMGIDSKDGMQGQNDHISLLMIDRKNKELKILSIPRETVTEVEIYNDNGEFLGISDTLLGLAYPNGVRAGKGALKTIEATQKILYNIPIVYYVVGNLNILPHLPEIVGDVDIILPDDSMAYLNPEWVEGYSFNVNSETIELFLRARDINDSFTNRTRTERQNLYLKWFFDNMNNDIDSSILFNELIDIINDSETNISISEASALYDIALQSLSNEQFAYTIEGRYATGLYYEEFYPNREELLSLIIELFYIKEI